jgi:hypothetical protein
MGTETTTSKIIVGHKTAFYNLCVCQQQQHSQYNIQKLNIHTIDFDFNEEQEIVCF